MRGLKLSVRCAGDCKGVDKPGYRTSPIFACSSSHRARATALLEFLSSRTERVSSPASNWNASKGFKQGPVSRIIAALEKDMNVRFPNFSHSFKPWNPGDGSKNCGNRVWFLSQSNLPLSMMMPAVFDPDILSHSAEAITISAP
jgi:hypothetical protein